LVQSSDLEVPLVWPLVWPLVVPLVVMAKDLDDGGECNDQSTRV